MRDLLRGRATYGELADSPEGIPTNILADRLRRMEASGLIKAKPYQRRPVRYAYSLTAKGLDLNDVLAAVARWVSPAHPRHECDARVPEVLNQACQIEFDSLEFAP